MKKTNGYTKNNLTQMNINNDNTKENTEYTIESSTYSTS